MKKETKRKEVQRKETENEIDAESRNEIQELFQELFVGQINWNMEAMEKKLKSTADSCEKLAEAMEQQVNQLREMDEHTLMLENSLDEKLEEKLGEKMTGFAGSVNNCLQQLFNSISSLEELLKEQKKSVEEQAISKLDALEEGVSGCQSSLDLVVQEVSGCRSNLNILTEKMEMVQEIKRCLEELGKQLNYSKELWKLKAKTTELSDNQRELNIRTEELCSNQKQLESRYGDMIWTVQNIQNALERLEGEWKEEAVIYEGRNSKEHSDIKEKLVEQITEEGRLTREAMTAEHKKNMRGLWLAMGGLFLVNILLLVLMFVK